MAIGEFHDVVEALLADSREVFGLFDLCLVDDEIEHDLVLVFVHELAFFDRVD